MRWEFIDTLHCPYSGSQFHRPEIVHENDSGIDYGILSSEAGDFPIVDGILRLKVDEYRQPLVNLVKSRRYEDALLTAIEVPPFSRCGSAMNFLERLAVGRGRGALAGGIRAFKQRLYRAFTSPTGTLTETLQRIRMDSWANWQIYRFSMPAFLPVYPLLNLIAKDEPVLDFGCGAGHAGFLISRRVDGSRITCVDHQFSLLYLTRKFFVGKANLVCLDGNYPLPFDSGYFSSVLSSDVLHLIDSKVSLSREFQRVIQSRGAIILPHLHNRLSPVQFGKSLSPEGYSALFEGVERRVVPEDWIVEQYVRNDSLDLEREWTDRELHGALKGLSVVASKNESVFRRSTGLWKEQTARMMNPAINPLYRTVGEPGKWMLRKDAPVSVGNASIAVDGYCPATAALEVPTLCRDSLLGLKTSNPAMFGSLAKQFVLIDVPDRFS